MGREAGANAGADKQRRTFIEAKNLADGMVHQVGKTLSEQGAALSPADKQEADAAVAAVQAALEGTDHDVLTTAIERLNQIEIKLLEAASKARPPGRETPRGPRPGANDPGTKHGENVVVAEFEEVADQNRSA